jgi:hypothetical protein
MLSLPLINASKAVSITRKLITFQTVLQELTRRHFNTSRTLVTS